MLCKKHINLAINITRNYRKIASINVVGENKFTCLELKFSNDSIKIPLVWFRDHCQSEAYYNHKTNQRKSKLLDIFNQAQIHDKDSIRLNVKEQLLCIQWKDGHQSFFNTEDILKWTIQPTDSLPYILWNKNTLVKIPSLTVEHFDMAKFCLLYAKYGVVQVENVEKSADATKELCKLIAPIHETFFGDFWVFGTDETIEEEREDTAYGTEEIGPHTDGTYFNQTPGIQVFQCLKPANEGGDTIIVDGFAVAEKFRQIYPEYFNILSSTPVEHHYLEKINSKENNSDNSNTLCSRAMYHPIIRIHNHRIIQIRFNPYDRAPLPVNQDEDVTTIVKFYEAYQLFSQFIHDSENAVQVSLQPGTVIFIDNYRVLHARTAFKGARKMCGCYLSRDDFLAKARTVLPSEFKHI